eukprot:m51a1_g7928 putative soss complex subunit b1 (147) ;mRNA; r:43580-44131
MMAMARPAGASGERTYKIAELGPSLKVVNCAFIVLDKQPPILTKDAHALYQFRVADYTACVNLLLYDDAGDALQPGDIVRLHGGYTSVHKGAVTLYRGQRGVLERTGEFCMLFTEMPNVSARQWSQDDGSSSPTAQQMQLQMPPRR